MKVSRIVLLFRALKCELSRYLHPQIVRKVYLDGRVIDREILHSVYMFLIAYVLIFAGSTLLIGIDNYDLTTNFTAVAATLNNIGPGLELVGPTQNFALYSNFSKLVLIFDMLAGRLEIFPILLLFTRATWKKFQLKAGSHKQRSGKFSSTSFDKYLNQSRRMFFRVCRSRNTSDGKQFSDTSPGTDWLPSLVYLVAS